MLNLISKPVTRFPDLFMVAALAEPEGQFTFTLERQVDGRTCTGLARMGVKRALDGSQLVFGIGSAFDMVFASDPTFKTSRLSRTATAWWPSTGRRSPTSGTFPRSTRS